MEKNNTQYGNLAGLMVRAWRKYPDEFARLKSGLELATCDGHVKIHPNGTATVIAMDGQHTYLVNGKCKCPDAIRRHQEHCKHRWAKTLVHRAQTENVPVWQASAWVAGHAEQGVAYGDGDAPCFWFVASHTEGGSWVPWTDIALGELAEERGIEITHGTHGYRAELTLAESQELGM